MKRNKILVLFTAAAMLVAGCKDTFLEEKRDLAGYNEEVFKDAALAQGYVDYVYGLFLPGNNAQSLSWNLATANDNFARTTDEFAGETDFNKVWSTISYTNSHALNYFGARLSTSIVNNPYTRLKQINIFLAEIDKYGLPEDTRNKLKGQMYFWRAWQYFDLVRLYGGVPLALVPQDPISDDGTSLQIPRSSSSDCIKQIVTDLDLAQSLLPGKWGSTDWGRITSGACAALKGRVLLTWASPLFNRNDDAARWEEAYKANLAAKTLLEANGSALFKTGGTANGVAWGNMWFTEVNNPEAVIVYGFNNLAIGGTTTKNNGWEQAARSKELNGGGSLSPTKQIVDAFPMKDGKMPGSSTYTYDAKKFYKNRDPRFYKTFVYNGAVWPYNGSTGANFKQWTYKWYNNATATIPSLTTETKGANSSGIYLCKATDPAASNANGNFQQNGMDYMEMRFAEVVLNLAESAIGSNRLSEGLEGIKSIRERAGVENLDGAYGLGGLTSRDQLFGAVIKERGIEFAYEGKRFFDLRRWMLFEENSPTAARLGIKPLNGTRRTGYFITVKTTAGARYNGSTDPLIKPATGNAPVIDRDPATYPTPNGSANYAAYLDYLYDNYFVITEKDDLDVTNPANWKFTWYPQYYFFGLNENILSASPYLEQTTGWNSLKGAGTFDPLK
ncbi:MULTISPECIES: RagB/SusD family nutrient uptake outer membrane protein [Pedobacter]|uniref:RagB/SusD family nutrient uptake outer membrane protein n=1 Tax=Pedobacter TaxID=84567 RepID=UPI00064A6E42|nr:MULTISPECIES: RagB/SusD family nutrient uptake outer membrane protein [Pedobacter]KLT64418.1 RagB/SusD family protein [Pedobacter sp. BMA]